MIASTSSIVIPLFLLYSCLLLINFPLVFLILVLLDM